MKFKTTWKFCFGPGKGAYQFSGLGYSLFHARHYQDFRRKKKAVAEQGMVNGQWIWRKYSASFSTPSTQKKITDLSWTKTQLHTHFGIQKKTKLFLVYHKILVLLVMYIPWLCSLLLLHSINVHWLYFFTDDLPSSKAFRCCVPHVNFKHPSLYTCRRRLTISNLHDHVWDFKICQWYMSRNSA